MTVTIIGTGHMARGIGTRLVSGGTGVALQGRDPEKAEALAEMLRGAASDGTEVGVLEEGAAFPGETVVLAVPYSAAAGVLKENGPRLAGKIVVDVTNPLNERYDGFAVSPGGSGAEELAKLLPEGARLVKAFNTTFSGTLAEGSVAGVPLDVFMAGDDEDAKATIGMMIKRGGLNPIDAGPLERARQLEHLAFLGISLQVRLNTGFRTAWKLIVPE